MNEQASERVGPDVEALSEELASGTSDTLGAAAQLENHQLRGLWWVGQWHDGAFRALDPAARHIGPPAPDSFTAST